MKKKPYFVIKIPVFPANLYICMDDPSFKEMLKDKNVVQKIDAMDSGAMAETHAIQTAEGKTIIALVLDLLSIDDLDRTLVHESVHLAERIFEYMGEETPGEEIRAYLTEYIYKEIKVGIEQHGIGKRNRKLLDEKNQTVVDALLQMAQHSNGSAGQNSDSKPKGTVRRTQNTNRKTKPKTNTRI